MHLINAVGTQRVGGRNVLKVDGILMRGFASLGNPSSDERELLVWSGKEQRYSKQLSR
jgi:hypothetical protein